MKKRLIYFNSKVIINLILAALIFTVLFLTEYKVYAYFSKSASENVGLQVKLGSIELTVKPQSFKTINNPIVIESEENTIELKQNVKNNGTLIGKLAYKITLLDYQNNQLESSFIETKVNNSEVTDVNNYQILTDEYKRSVMLKPQEAKDLVIEIDPLSLHRSVEKCKVQIEFLLFQENGTIEKPLFHDIEKVVYELQLKENSFIDTTIKSKESHVGNTKASNESTFNDETNNVQSSQENDIEQPIEMKNDFLDINQIPEDKLFDYAEIKLINETYQVGMIQDQFDWLMNFESIKEFSNQLTNSTPAIYVKYDKVIGVENIEKFVYQLLEENQLSSNVSLKDIPERKMLEIKFIK
ncbi:hypothetical protein ACQKKE_10810 [Desemzia incerta]|uniref:hypothetical protein n=1 Tax=Desemzia incerta TaxID=82801 RepID=UPI003D00C2DF